jgi:hypothetical protein
VNGTFTEEAFKAEHGDISKREEYVPKSERMASAKRPKSALGVRTAKERQSHRSSDHDGTSTGRRPSSSARPSSAGVRRPSSSGRSRGPHAGDIKDRIPVDIYEAYANEAYTPGFSNNHNPPRALTLEEARQQRIKPRLPFSKLQVAYDRTMAQRPRKGLDSLISQGKEYKKKSGTEGLSTAANNVMSDLSQQSWQDNGQTSSLQHHLALLAARQTALGNRGNGGNVVQASARPCSAKSRTSVTSAKDPPVEVGFLMEPPSADMGATWKNGKLCAARMHGCLTFFPPSIHPSMCMGGHP